MKVVAAAHVVAALPSPSLGARVVARTPLYYRGGADPSLDRPAHVRAGSALARLAAGTFAVVQDDACFIAVVEGVGGARAPSVRDLPLPACGGVRQFDDVRGNKTAKLDLEACLVVDGGELLVAFGSGSSAARERVVLVEQPAGDEPRVTVVEARALYAALRANGAFAGSELNVEGAATCDADVMFFQRGNGAARDGCAAVDATARIDRAALLVYLRALRDSGTTELAVAPPIRDVTAWDLGSLDGTRLTFTDAVTAPGRWTAFLACAEASPDATRDGPVSGVAIGRLDDRAREAAFGRIADERGAPLLDKAEGIAFDETDRGRAWLVVDRDDPAAAAELLELRLGPGWQT